MKSEFKERIEIKKTPENSVDKLETVEKKEAPENPADKLKKIDIEQER